MGFNKKAKGLVVSSLVFSAVAPQTMGAQAVSLKGIKQSITAFFMRTFYFWFKKEEYLKKVMSQFSVEKNNLINRVKKEISETQDNVIKNLKTLDYEKVEELKFSEEGKLHKENDVLTFLEEKRSKVDEIGKKYVNVQKYILAFKCLKSLESLLNKTEGEVLDLIKKNEDIFKKFLELDLLPPLVKNVFEQKNIGFIKISENDKNQIENSISKLKEEVVKFGKKMGEESEENIFSEDFFKNKEEELWNLNVSLEKERERSASANNIAGSLKVALPEYFKEIENYERNIFNQDYEQEEKLYDLNEKIKTLKECKIYYTGNLDVFDG